MRPLSFTHEDSSYNDQGRPYRLSWYTIVDQTKNPKSGVAPIPNIVKLITSVQSLQQAVKTLIMTMTKQGKPKGEHHVIKSH